MRTRVAEVACTIAVGLCLMGGERLARAQCQVDKVTASAGNANAGDRYGWSVAVNGNYAVVGADVADGGGRNPQADTGAAFLLQRDGLNWVEIQKLVANDILATAGDAFGASVAISKNAELVVVGAIKAIGSYLRQDNLQDPRIEKQAKTVGRMRPDQNLEQLVPKPLPSHLGELRGVSLNLPVGFLVNFEIQLTG